MMLLFLAMYMYKYCLAYIKYSTVAVDSILNYANENDSHAHELNYRRTRARAHDEELEIHNARYIEHNIEIH